jgi:hypothetical protein
MMKNSQPWKLKKEVVNKRHYRTPREAREVPDKIILQITAFRFRRSFKRS